MLNEVAEQYCLENICKHCRKCDGYGCEEFCDEYHSSLKAFKAGAVFNDNQYTNWINQSQASKACESCLRDLYNIGSSINLYGNFQQFWEGFQGGILWEKQKSK